MITTNTSVASPPSSILIVGEPVLNSRKTSSHAHAKKKAKRTTTGTAKNVSSGNSPMDGNFLIPQETPTQRGAKKYWVLNRYCFCMRMTLFYMSSV